MSNLPGRKTYARIPEVLPLPHLIQVQLESYKAFKKEEQKRKKRWRKDNLDELKERQRKKSRDYYHNVVKPRREAEKAEAAKKAAAENGTREVNRKRS